MILVQIVSKMTQNTEKGSFLLDFQLFHQIIQHLNTVRCPEKYFSQKENKYQIFVVSHKD